MPDFFTPVKIPQFAVRIDYDSHVFFMGSCFAEYIGNRMKELKFNICHNPFGVVYNPHSMVNNLEQLLTREAYNEEDLSFHNELWFSFSHYTLFSHPERSECLKNINREFIKAKEFLGHTDLLVLTLGTSWVFRLKETGQVVSNCHKMPASEFDRTFLTVDRTTALLSQMITMLRKVNPGVKVLFTVSPIRHWKDGAIENQRSKSALILAIAEVQKTFKEAYYFPGYEIFMDELRDYRFYAADMLHPSEEALRYVWDKFSMSIMDTDTLQLIKNVEKILRSIKHKSRFPGTKSHDDFVKNTLESIENMENKYPNLNFSAEKSQIGKV